jgi:hypothetical protein
LEYGSESELENEGESILDIDPQLNEEYQLPELSALPSSYYGCVNALQDIDPKIQEALTSPSRARFTAIREQTSMFLMRGSLHDMEVGQARAGQIETHKRKLDARKKSSKRRLYSC